MREGDKRGACGAWKRDWKKQRLKRAEDKGMEQSGKDNTGRQSIKEK